MRVWSEFGEQQWRWERTRQDLDVKPARYDGQTCRDWEENSVFAGFIMLYFSLLVWGCSRRLFCPLPNYTSKSLNLVLRVCQCFTDQPLIWTNIPGQVTADKRIDRFFPQLRVHKTILSIKRTYFSLDYLKQYLNATKHVSKEAVQPSKQQRVNSHSRHKSLPAHSHLWIPHPVPWHVCTGRKHRAVLHSTGSKVWLKNALQFGT